MTPTASLLRLQLRSFGTFVPCHRRGATAESIRQEVRRNGIEIEPEANVLLKQIFSSAHHPQLCAGQFVLISTAGLIGQDKTEAELLRILAESFRLGCDECRSTDWPFVAQSFAFFPDQQVTLLLTKPVMIDGSDQCHYLLGIEKKNASLRLNAIPWTRLMSFPSDQHWIVRVPSSEED